MKLLNRILRSEGGQVLPAALVLLVLGGLLVVPMLALLHTNLTANRIIEVKTLGIYAADAGIQDALWKLGNDVDPFPGGNSYYNLSENINGMAVTVVREALTTEPDGDLYTLKSTARLNDEVKAVIRAQAFKGYEYGWLFEHALTSENDINLSPGDVVYGGALCGGQLNGDPDQIRSGEILEGQEINFPTEAQLSAFYRANVDSPGETPYYYPDHGYPNSTFSVSGGTPYAPVMIPPLYRNGDLSIVGDGYAKLEGTLYINGKFNFSDKDVTLDLNGQSIYATYYVDPCPTSPNPTNSAVYFGPDSVVYGPGCIIGVGHVEFQPKLGQGKYLFGTVDVDEWNPEMADRFLLSRFKAEDNGKLTSFQVKCSGEGNVKVALYDDSSGAPGTLRGAVDTAQGVIVGWNPITFPEKQIYKNTNYWLAAIADSAIICRKTTSSTNKYKSATFTGFTFPNPAGSGFTDQTTQQYMLRGFTGGQEFIFIMSVKCTTNLQPNASFYGSIAGNTNVNLQPGCFVSLVGLPEDGLDFPGMGPGGGGGGGGGTSLPLRNYNIQ